MKWFNWLVSKTSAYKDLSVAFNTLLSDFEAMSSGKVNILDLANKHIPAGDPELVRSLLSFIATNFIAALDEYKAPNYLEIRCREYKEKALAAGRTEPAEIVITAIRCTGKSPNDIIRELRAELDSLKAAITENKELTAVC